MRSSPLSSWRRHSLSSSLGGVLSGTPGLNWKSHDERAGEQSVATPRVMRTWLKPTVTHRRPRSTVLSRHWLGPPGRITVDATALQHSHMRSSPFFVLPVLLGTCLLAQTIALAQIKLPTLPTIFSIHPGPRTSRA